MDAIIPQGNTQLITSRDREHREPREHREHREHRDHRHNCATSEQVSITGMESRQLTNAEGCEIRSDINRAADMSNDQMRQFGLAGLNATKDGVKDILLQNCVDTASIKAQAASDCKDLLLQAAHNASSALLESAKHAAEIRLEMCKSHGELRLQAEKDRAFLELQACRDTAKLEAHIVECCHENRLLVCEKAAQTDALIRKLDEERYKDELHKTRNALIALQVRSTIPPLPVAATTVGSVI